MSSSRRWLLAAALAALAPPRAWGLSLRSSAAQLTLDVRPGERVEVGKDAGRPLTIADTGGESVVLEPRLQSPPRSDLADGYEPVPDLSWVAVSPPQAELSPGGEASLKVVVKAPAGKRWAGGQYEADVVARGRAAGGLSASVRTRLLLRVARDRGRLQELERSLPRRPRDVLPSSQKGAAEKVPLGEVVAVDSLGPSLKLANPGEERVFVRVESRPFDERETPPGCEPAPDPAWLDAGDQGVVEVPPGKVVSARLTLRIPDEPRYAGRRFAFAVDVEPLGAEHPSTRRYWLEVGMRDVSRTQEGAR